MFTTTSASMSRPTAFAPQRALSSTVLLCLLSLSSLVNVVTAATADEWRSRSIYQIITDRFALTNGSTTSSCPYGSQKYCGGTFKGIVDKLDYIQGMGFTAIWISPVTTAVDGNAALGDAYHGFWPKDITTINDHFGTGADLKELSAELHKRDMVNSPSKNMRT